MAKISPAEFLRQVKQEVAKITWPTRQEAMQMSLFVIIFAILSPYQLYNIYLAGAAGIEPATFGFGDRRSTS